MMQLGPQLLNLVSAISLILLLAQMAEAQFCLSFESAKQAQDVKVVICGSLLPTVSGDASDIPFACHRQATSIQALLTKEPGMQTLSSENICYLSYQESTTHINLNLDIVASKFTRPIRVRLLPSVSELFGVSPTLIISGKSLSTINPEVLKAMGPSAKENLKYLVLSDTGLVSIDLSLIEPLKIIGLLLMNNAQLSRITNFKGVNLPNMTELVLYNNNPSLIDCRNFMSLPKNLETMFLLQNTLNDCAFCYLPKAVTKVSVLQSIPNLPHYPSAVAVDSMMPFPLERPYGYIDTVATPEMYKEYTVSASTASGCEPACTCQKWPETRVASTARPTPKPDTSSNVVSGGGNAVSSGGDGGVVKQSSSSGDKGVVKQSSSSGGSGGGGGNAGSRLEASATGLLLASAALAMARAHL